MVTYFPHDCLSTQTGNQQLHRWQPARSFLSQFYKLTFTAQRALTDCSDSPMYVSNEIS